MHQPNLKPFVGRVNLNQKDRNTEYVGQLFSQREGHLDAFVSSIVPHPPFGHTQFLTQLRHVVRRVFKRIGFNLRLSEGGRAMLRRAAAAVRAVETQFFAALGPDLPAFSDALRFLAGERPRRRVQAVSRPT